MLAGPNAPLDLERGLSSSYMEHAYDFYKPCGLYPLVRSRNMPFALPSYGGLKHVLRNKGGGFTHKGRSIAFSVELITWLDLQRIVVKSKNWNMCDV